MQFRTRHSLLALVTMIVLMLTASVARADHMEGTPAWSTAVLTLHQGPGGNYAVVGQIPENARITVHRCSPLWCVVEAGHEKGWSRSGAINFGRGPNDWAIPSPMYATGGRACLYDGANYTGDSLCIDGGSVYSDLLLEGLDNHFSSIKIEAGSFSLCRDRKFQSYCSRITESQPVLNSFLNNNVSSVRGHRQ